VLLLHEVHHMVGKREKEFEASYQAWMAALAEEEGARLLWFLHHAHGSGPSYQAVTITGLAGGAAWEHLTQRVHRGDLRQWSREVDGCRHRVQGRLLMPLDWSPFDVDLAGVPTDGRHHETSLYMEDTMWPKRGKVDEYIAAAGEVYPKVLGAHAEGQVLLRIEAASQTMPGAGRGPEVTLMQKVHSMSRARPPADPRHPGGDEPPRHVDARRPRVPRPVAQQAAPGRIVVPAVVRSWR
jgi:hypothetical protein